MRRRSFMAAAFTLLATLPGCDGQKPFGKYTTAELEKEIAGRLQFEEVALTDKGNGMFTGTGKKATGEVYELEITRTDRTLKWQQSHKNAAGEVVFHGEGGASQ